MILVSIIIISFNTKNLTERCLRSLKKSIPEQDMDRYEIIVVDNHSTDGSIEMIRNNFPWVNLIQNRENIGFGKANNIGTDIAKGTYLLFLNSDTEIISDAIVKLTSRIEHVKDPVIIGPKLLNKDMTPQASAGRFYSIPVIILSLFFKGDQLHLTRSSPNTEQFSEWVSGACLMIKKSVFDQIGKFDENIFMYMDEVDLCYRAKKMGIPTLFFADAQVIHIGSASSGDKRAPYMNLFKGLILFYRKHDPKWLPLVKVLIYIKCLLAVIFGFMTRNKSLEYNYSNAWSMIKKA